MRPSARGGHTGISNGAREARRGVSVARDLDVSVYLYAWDKSGRAGDIGYLP
jgi:hypothetical protein